MRKAIPDHGVSFGTDGWRGLIADAFTVRRLEIVAQAFAEWAHKAHGRHAKILIGYDGRYGGERFGMAAARVVAGNGLPTHLIARPMPTPAISWEIPRKHYAAGLMVTASHNPPAYSGVKIKPFFGGSPDETVIGPIVDNLGRIEPKRADANRVGRVDMLDDYVRMLARFVDREELNKLRGTVASDPMGGAQAGLLSKTLKGTRLKVDAIHDTLDPMFAGLAAPEPVEKNLEALKAHVRKTKAILGIATDGDGDRIGLVDDTGTFVSPSVVFALLLVYLIRDKRLSGGIVKTVSGSFMLDRIARHYGRELHETPVGFKYICKLMRERDIVMGGEESGGVGIKGYIPERDGHLAGLVALEMLGRTGKKCSQLIRDLHRQFGASTYARIDAHHPTAQASLKKLISSPPDAVNGKRVAKVSTMDGLKLTFADDSWLLFRASGTEPLLRVYAEHETARGVNALLTAGAKLAGVKGGH